MERDFNLIQESYNLSVVIPAYREDVYLNRLLSCLSQPGNSADRVVVAVGPDSSRTRALCQKHPSLDVVTVQTSLGVATARNTGARSTDSFWLLFLDADVMIPENFVARLVSAAEDTSLDLVTTSFLAVDGSRTVNYLGTLLSRYFWTFRNTHRPALNGGCILVRRDVFTDIGGFNEKLRYGEDHDLARRCVSAGYRFTILDEPRYLASARRYSNSGPLERSRTLAPYVLAEVRRLI
ncbi:MAG: glycosyltransferase family 2 protein [Acetobacteraceae bacterium]|jgi:GT2 family glycosyltransferase